MKRRHGFLGMALPLALVAVWSSLAQAPAPATGEGPLAPFARMVEGSWQMTMQSGRSQRETWHWGPGKHSLRGETTGFGGAGEPWRGVEVVYWHPGREEVRLLGLSPYAQGVAEGAIRFEGETVHADLDLSQTGGRRTIRRRWTFDDADTYRSTLWDQSLPEIFAPLVENGSGPVVEQPAPLGEWLYVRTATRAPIDPDPRDEAPRPSPGLEALVQLAGTWEAERAEPGAGAATASIVEWVPYADFVYLRTVAKAGTGDGEHLLDAYVYDRPGIDGLRCLALTHSGGVYVGDVTVTGDGSLQLDLTGYGDGRVTSWVVRLDRNEDATVRDRAWIVEQGTRSLVRDLRHVARRSE